MMVACECSRHFFCLNSFVFSEFLITFVPTKIINGLLR